MGAHNLQAAVSRRVHPVNPDLAAVVALARASLGEQAFVLDFDDEARYRAASAARVLIAEELAALVNRLTPVRIRLMGAPG